MIMKMLRIQPARDKTIVIKEPLSYTGNVMRNRIWYRGDPSELDQFFKKSASDDVSKSRFWAAVPSVGNVRKMHSGLPSIIVERLSDIVISDIDSITVNNDNPKTGATKVWEDIAKDNNFIELLSSAIIETLVTGDGAFKISVDTDLTPYPIIEFYSGENVDYNYERGRLKEIWFYDFYTKEQQEYKLKVIYGKGYIDYRLYDNSDKEVDINSLDETKGLSRTEFDLDKIMGIPLSFMKSAKFKDRGKSIYEGKSDSFDALDETLSQWIDAIRDGRVTKYMPDDLIPRDKDNGELLTPNPFDNKFIKVKSAGLSESGDADKIDVVQPSINYEAYVATYANDLDKCLQGIISPSTLGIDLKKTDNAEAQREKEKTTLYTRGKIIDTLSEETPELIQIVLQVNDILYGKKPGEYEAMIEFGEYSTPTFDQTIETVGQAAQNNLMSVETRVESIWGDRKDETWKEEEVKRLKELMGIADVDEPRINMDVGGFKTNVEGGLPDEGAGGEENVQHDPEGIPGVTKNSQ